MKVHFEETGGLAGIGSYASVDSDLLLPKEVSELEQLIKDADFLQLAPQSSITSRGADYLKYKITLETDNIKHSISTTDLTMPPNVRPLVRYLRQKVTKKAPRNKRSQGSDLR